MKSDKKNANLSRKEFLRIGGSVLAGGTILGLSGVTLWKNIQQKNRASQPVSGLEPVSEAFQSPYQLTSSFSVPDSIQSFDLQNGQLLVSTENEVFLYQPNGTLIHQFPVNPNLRDVALSGNNIYLMYPSKFEVYDTKGAFLREWEACNENADYCSMAVGGNAVFVTDASNKVLVKYTASGKLERFIESPNRFIIPSYTFGITYADGVIYCSNPGRHQVEKYSENGKYLGAFGEAGGIAGKFCGCCNPVHLSYTSNGEIITSEKGNPRVSCYNADGTFQSQLLDASMLGGGNTAYRVKVIEDKIFVAGKNLVSTFQYNKTLAQNSACGTCKKNCPLREGISI